MRSVNKVILIGNLTRDPELRETTSNQPVCTFGIATNREWITKEGQKNSSTEFHELVAWAKLADICHKYLKKGKLIYVEGYLKTRSWDTPEGVRKFKTEIIIQDMIMLEKRPKEEGEEILIAPTEEPTEEYQPKNLPEEKPEKKEKKKPEKKEKPAEEETKTTEEKKPKDINIDEDLKL